MSLVDYASSDEEEEDLKEDKQLPKAEEPTPSSAPLDPLPTRNQNPHLPQPQNQLVILCIQFSFLFIGFCSLYFFGLSRVSLCFLSVLCPKSSVPI